MELCPACFIAEPPVEVGDLIRTTYGDAIRCDAFWLVRHAPYRFFKLPVRSLEVREVVRAHEKNDRLWAARFFAKHYGNARMLELGFLCIAFGNMRALGPLDIMPDTSKGRRLDDSGADWRYLRSKLEVGDILFNRDTDSLLSNFIANIDGGSWSHSSTCGPDGLICSATLEGVQIMQIDDLRKASMRFGLYRPLGVHGPQWALWNFCVYQAARKTSYKYSGAIIAAIRARFKLRGPSTPNGLVYGGRLAPVAFV